MSDISDLISKMTRKVIDGITYIRVDDTVNELAYVRSKIGGCDDKS